MEFVIGGLVVVIGGLLGVGRHYYRLYKSRETELHSLAYFDSLTGLSNRLRFNEVATQIISSNTQDNGRVALMLVDVDSFKNVNDTHGHQVGDKFLKEVATRLQAIVSSRGAANAKDLSFAARLGGDEFVILINKIHDAQEAAAITEKLFQAMAFPIVVGASVIQPSISVGISLYPYDGQNLSAVLKSADLALYTAKEKGKNTFYFHERSMNTKYERGLEYQAIIKYFVETGDFRMHYQPIVDTKYGEVRGAEALFGGNRLKYSSLNIEELVRTAEQTNEIVELGAMIMRRSCEDYVQYMKGKYQHREFVFSVNVSANQLEDPKFVDRVKTILEETGMPPNQLGLEITETALILNYIQTAKKLEQLKQLGIRISIDDFGKGYSSMSYLKKLAVHKLKIDRSFIEDITDKKSIEIVRTLIVMSKTLGLVCVAEGIETEAQYRFLKGLECDRAQGYLISAPISPDLFEFFPGYELPTTTLRRGALGALTVVNS